MEDLEKLKKDIEMLKEVVKELLTDKIRSLYIERRATQDLGEKDQISGEIERLNEIHRYFDEG